MDLTHSPFLYKICSAVEWRKAAASGLYRGSAEDRRDGYVHLSTGRQLPATLKLHFGGRTRLVLIAFESSVLGPGLKWEPARGGELFPHFYGALRPSAARWLRPIPDSGRDDFLRRLPVA